MRGAVSGQMPVLFHGRVYTLYVMLPFRLPEDRALPMGLRTLGECLVILAGQIPETHECLTKQKLSLKERPLGPCSQIELPDVTLSGTASSTDPLLARRMLIDRLCLALNEIQALVPAARDILSAHFVTILRTQ